MAVTYIVKLQASNIIPKDQTRIIKISGAEVEIACKYLSVPGGSDRKWEKSDFY